MRFSEYPFLRYTVFFILGILIYPYLDVEGWRGVAFWTLFFFLLYAVLLLINAYQQRFTFKTAFPPLAYALLFSMGILFTFLKDHQNDPMHILYRPKMDGYVGLVEDLDQQKPNSYANRVRVKAVRQEGEFHPASGKVIIYHKLTEKLQPGELVYIIGHPDPVAAPTNPFEFDYQRFLATRQIFHTHFVNAGVIRIGKISQQPLNDLVLKIRASFMERIDRYIPSPHSNQIAKALLLGQKQDLDEEVSEAYITAGTMHVLAVSGLHVGIIYGFFFLFLKPHRLAGKTRVLYLSLVILIIWLYALITGMSPSVLRAATMFTLMGLAQMKSRRPSIINALALSALILMVFDPYIVYSVGFQLSYMAVLGIVLLQPWIVRWWEPQHRIVYYFWEISSVGIAAQLATFPISVYYFHVFPTYFMVSNLIAIPGAFLIMAIGIPFILISFVEAAGRWLGLFLDFLIGWENRVIFSFQDLPAARLADLHISPPEMILVWMLTAFLLLLAQEKKKKYAFLSLLMLSGLAFTNCWSIWQSAQKNELFIYEMRNGFAVDHFYRGRLYSGVLDAEPKDVSYKVHPNRIRQGQAVDQPLRYLKAEGFIFFPLPGNAFLKINGKEFEVGARAIKDISYFTAGTWHASGLDQTGIQREVAYRITFD